MQLVLREAYILLNSTQGTAELQGCQGLSADTRLHNRQQLCMMLHEPLASKAAVLSWTASAYDRAPALYSGPQLLRRQQKMLRVVVREDLTYEMATDLVKDIVATVDWLDHHFTYSRAFVGSLCATSACCSARLAPGTHGPGSRPACKQGQHAATETCPVAAEEQMNDLRTKFTHHPEHGKKHKRRPGHSKKHFAPC